MILKTAIFNLAYGNEGFSPSLDPLMIEQAELIYNQGFDIVFLNEMDEGIQSIQADTMRKVTELSYFAISLNGIGLFSRFPLYDISYHTFPNPSATRTK